MTDGNLTKVFLSRVADFSMCDMDLICGRLSARGRRKALNAKNNKVRNRSLTAEFLLWHVLTRETDMLASTFQDSRNIWGLSDIPELDEGEEGKPYLRDYPDVSFSLSHSGDYVLCAVSEDCVGADIQKKEPLKADIASRFYSDAERKLIACSEDSLTAFYHIWVLKESYVKYTGKGLSEGLDSFSVYQIDGVNGDKPCFSLDAGHNQDGKLRLSIYDMDEYAIGVCHKGNIVERPSLVDIRVITDKINLLSRSDQGGSL